jgi:hypothetical protein
MYCEMRVTLQFEMDMHLHSAEGYRVCVCVCVCVCVSVWKGLQKHCCYEFSVTGKGQHTVVDSSVVFMCSE